MTSEYQWTPEEHDRLREKRTRLMHQVTRPNGSVRLYQHGSGAVYKAHAAGWQVEVVNVTPVTEVPVGQPWRNVEFDKDYAPTRNYFRRLDRKHDRECKAGYVYLATNGRCVKIGESVNPDRRVGQGNTFAMPGEEWRIVWAWYVEDRKRAEKDLHVSFTSFNLRLELYELDAENPQALTGEGWYIEQITGCLEVLDHV